MLRSSYWPFNNIVFVSDFLSKINFKQKSKQEQPTKRTNFWNGFKPKKQQIFDFFTRSVNRDVAGSKYDVRKVRGCYVGSVGSTHTQTDGRALSVLLTSEPGRIHWWLTSKRGGGNALASRSLVPPPADLEAAEQRSSLAQGSTQRPRHRQDQEAASTAKVKCFLRGKWSRRTSPWSTVTGSDR